MKALSVKQPWAFLISTGQKSIELRSWQTDYRGKLLICASASEKNAWVKDSGNDYLLPAGVMICVVDLVDVRPATQSDEEAAFAEGEGLNGLYAWVLENPRDVMLKKVIGRLRLFDVADDKIIAMPDDDDWFEHSEKLKPPKAKINDYSMILE